MIAAILVFVVSLGIIASARPRTGFVAPFAAEQGMPIDRPAGALIGALGMVLCGVVAPRDALEHGVNYDTLLLLFGMMVICAYMVEARLFRFVSFLVLSHVGSARRLLVAVVLVSGLLSAVLVNDTVCLMTTPLVLQCCRDARLKPLPFLLAVAFGANAGSVATPTGNPQNMIIGTLSGIPYARFVRVLGLPALVSLLVVAGLLILLCRRELPSEPLPSAHLERPAFDPALAAKCLLALGLVLGGFFLGYSMAWTALFGAVLLMLIGRRTPRRIMERVDYVLLVFFAGLFVLVYGVGKVGLAEVLFGYVRPLLGSEPLRQVLVFGVFTELLSQVVSNVPFVLLASQWMPHFSDPPLMWLSMAMFSTLAGNLTIVGSVANIIVLETAGEDGRIGFWRFLRYGAVITIVTSAVGFAILYLERRAGLL